MLRGVDALLAGETPSLPKPACLTCACSGNVVLDGRTRSAAAFDRHCPLSRAGARIVAAERQVRRNRSVNSRGGFAASGIRLASHPARGEGLYDPRIASASNVGKDKASRLHRSVNAAGVHCELRRRTREFDALIMPTVPIVAPCIAELDDEREYNRINILLRNTAINGC